ncbi:hypothetical protein SCLCIDRAFT_1216597 [Scleroderma citrinum Foug A]|uniref:Protein kinase domain-containing protein n=1 Tax=Scleroderma citrinum Foug A TaxID=1036808 RepID=A0A0C2ZG94_9AGAM|nr:hypothetical protein SCLCIDRAFT_1216597 [Scleroderma citrinum Foug A]
MDKVLAMLKAILQHFWTASHVGDSPLNGRQSQFRPLDKKIKGVRVVRNGVECTISVWEVVVGDIALLAPGEIIPCDGIFLFGHNVTCDESASTGEITVVKKAPFSQCVALKQAHPRRIVDAKNYASASRDTCGHGMDCFIVSGSKVLEGVGRYVVVGTKNRVTMAHGAPTYVLSNKSFKRFFTRLCRVPHPEALPTVGSDMEWNSSIGLHSDNIVAPTYLRGCRDIPVSSTALHIPHFGPPEDDPFGSTSLLRVGTNQNHPEDIHSPFDNNKVDTLDLQPEVCDLAKRASRYCLDLGDTVHRDVEHYATGGSAFVYRGTLDPEGTAIAVKTFRFGHKSDPGVVKSICREVHIWSKLHNDNILPVLGFTTKFDQTISIVSPWMERGNAHDYVQDVDVDPRPLLVGIATGLQYLHSYEPHPIYHGDLKGFNVLISDDGCPLLTDFGFAFIVDSSFSMDVEGGRGGTLQWMAPEYFGLWEDSTATERDAWAATAEKDVWAFGMTILELFTRQRPFPGVDKGFQLIPRIRMGHPRPSDEVTCSRLTDEWWNICLLCWHLDPSKRPRVSDVLAKIPMGSSHGCML